MKNVKSHLANTQASTCAALNYIALHCMVQIALHTSHQGFGITRNILARVIYQCDWLHCKSTFYFLKSCTLVVFPLFLLQHRADKYCNSKLIITKYCDIFDSKLMIIENCDIFDEH